METTARSPPGATFDRSMLPGCLRIQSEGGARLVNRRRQLWPVDRLLADFLLLPLDDSHTTLSRQANGAVGPVTLGAERDVRAISGDEMQKIEQFWGDLLSILTDRN